MHLGQNIRKNYPASGAKHKQKLPCNWGATKLGQPSRHREKAETGDVSIVPRLMVLLTAQLVPAPRSPKQIIEVGFYYRTMSGYDQGRT
jgi:hypothetical protein